MNTTLSNNLESQDTVLLHNNPKVTIGVVTYNGKDVIKPCLDSLLTQSYQNFQILVIDNASTDGTPEWINQNYPQVQVIYLTRNLGPSPARNFAIRNTPDNQLTLLVDDDAILHKDCLAHLVDAYIMYPDSAVFSPSLVYDNQPDQIQYQGTFIHYTAEAIHPNHNQSLQEGFQEITPIHAANTTCMLVVKNAAQAVDFFDEDYFFGRTDGEFTFRLTLSGWKLYCAPKAICYHKVKERGLSKVFYQVRNRWFFILSLYSLNTLVLLLPSFLVYELSLILFLLLKGKIIDYIRAIISLMIHFYSILEKRQTIQATKILPDREALQGGLFSMRSTLTDQKFIAMMKRVLNQFFDLYWQLIKPLI